MRGTGGLVERIRGGARRVLRGSGKGLAEDDADVERAGPAVVGGPGGGVGDLSLIHI